jgi:hypothetical protein
MLNYYGDSITKMRAEASTRTTNGNPQMQDYGLTWEQTHTEGIKLRYEEVMDNDGSVHNPLTESKINDILSTTESKLDNDDHDYKPDLAVEEMKIEVSCPELTEQTRSRTDTYIITFKSDPVEDTTVQRETQKRNIGRGLYSELRFKKRNLNVHGVEEKHAMYGGQGDATLMRFDGLDDLRPFAPDTVVDAVNNQLLPDEFTEEPMKTYRVDENEELTSLGFGGGGDTDD